MLHNEASLSFTWCARANKWIKRDSFATPSTDQSCGQRHLTCTVNQEGLGEQERSIRRGGAAFYRRSFQKGTRVQFDLQWSILGLSSRKTAAVSAFAQSLGFPELQSGLTAKIPSKSIVLESKETSQVVT